MWSNIKYEEHLSSENVLPLHSASRWSDGEVATHVPADLQSISKLVSTKQREK